MKKQGANTVLKFSKSCKKIENLHEKKLTLLSHQQSVYKRKTMDPFFASTIF